MTPKLIGTVLFVPGGTILLVPRMPTSTLNSVGLHGTKHQWLHY